MVIGIIVDLKLVILDVIVGAPLKPVLSIVLVQYLYNDITTLVDHDLVAWVLLANDVYQFVLVPCFYVSFFGKVQDPNGSARHKLAVEVGLAFLDSVDFVHFAFVLASAAD